MLDSVWLIRPLHCEAHKDTDAAPHRPMAKQRFVGLAQYPSDAASWVGPRTTRQSAHSWTITTFGRIGT